MPWAIYGIGVVSEVRHDLRSKLPVQFKARVSRSIEYINVARAEDVIAELRFQGWKNTKQVAQGSLFSCFS